MKTYLEPREVKMMEDSVTNLRDRLLIRLLFHLGCRVSEALALKVEDVDFARGTVTSSTLKVVLGCPVRGAEQDWAGAILFALNVVKRWRRHWFKSRSTAG